MFICMPKIRFIIYFFLEIIHFKESCNLIGRHHFDTQNWRTRIFEIWDWWWNISNNISFQFTLFPKKLMTKVFKKSQKKPILVPFWVLSCPNLPTKKGCQFLNIPIIYHHAQNQKKLKTHSWEKCRTDGRRDGQTDGRKDGWTDGQTDRKRWFF